MNDFLLPSPSSLMTPHRLSDPIPWIGHIPFAFWLLEQARPAGDLVELGTHAGNSYFTFCQAVLANGLPTRCHAVDTWEGDRHSQAYGEEVYQGVSSYNHRHYRDFSRLLRMPFDEARADFPDGSVDLLHLDGLHTYDAVREDFEHWRPKLSNSAIVLFHDTAVREKDFGVWKLWEEVSRSFPNIAFEHSSGLGVLFVGKCQPPAIEILFGILGTPKGRALVLQYFEKLGRVLELEWQNAKLVKQLARRERQQEEIRTSFSWRITGPVRVAARQFARFCSGGSPED